MNPSDLIRNRTADRKGNTLPVDANAGTYDVEELAPGSHNLMANALAVDSSLGSQVRPPILRCCGTDDAAWDPGAFDLVIDGTDFGSVQGTDQCTGQPVDISGEFSDWSSGNTAVATVTTKQVHGVAAGATDAFATGFVTVGNDSYCTVVKEQVEAPVDVGLPTSETTSFYGMVYTTEGAFEMTLNPNVFDYDGNTVTESDWAQGANSCWWPSAPFSQYPSVANSTWTIGATPAPHDGYGLDGIGFTSTGVAYIQAHAGANGIKFPCEVVFYQEMSYETFLPYAYNIDSQTIGQNTVQVCRAGVCGPVVNY